MKVLIKVTRDHIEQGRPKFAAHCPVALALRDAGLGSCPTAWQHLFFVAEGRLVKVPTPPEVLAWIKEFDREGRTEEVGEISFEIDTSVATPG